jgi:chaperonin GroEL (HSP60 family)
MGKTKIIALSPKMVFADLGAAERAVSKKNFCQKAGISEFAFSARLRGEVKWKPLEQQLFAEIFNVSIEIIQF